MLVSVCINNYLFVFATFRNASSIHGSNADLLLEMQVALIHGSNAAMVMF